MKRSRIVLSMAVLFTAVVFFCSHPELSPFDVPWAVHSPDGDVPHGQKAYSPPDSAMYACEIEPWDCGNIGIFDRGTGDTLAVIDTEQHPEGDTNHLKGLAWSPDSKRIATMYHYADYDGKGHISIIEWKTATSVKRITVEEEYHFMVFSSDGTKILASCSGAEVDTLDP